MRQKVLIIVARRDKMRLDKFLKVARIIKRRTLAKEICDQGRVKKNGQVLKASSELKVGDILEISLGQKVITIRIEGLKDNVKKEEVESLYTII